MGHLELPQITSERKFLKLKYNCITSLLHFPSSNLFYESPLKLLTIFVIVTYSYVHTYTHAEAQRHSHTSIHIYICINI